MRAIVITALGLAAAVPAWAGSYGIGYLGLRGSYVNAEDQSTTSPMIDDHRSFKDGWGASGFFGFIVDEALRGEVEAGYRTSAIDKVRVDRNDLLPASAGSDFAADGQVDMGFAMLNLFYDFHIEGLPVLPWVGVGVGGAHVNYQFDYDYGDPLAPARADASDWQFAYQLMAGVTVPVGKTTSMSLGYRYFKTEEMILTDAYSNEFHTDLTNHSFDLGLQFHL
jgi:opacity protein-like surface antigen